MTNIYVRIKRNGQWEPIEMDQLTDAEMDAFISSQGDRSGWPFVKALAKWIRDTVKDST
jgi:hypothetical protein